MTEKKVLKAEGVDELVGAVTALLGYMPAQSLVIAPLTGTTRHERYAGRSPHRRRGLPGHGRR